MRQRINPTIEKVMERDNIDIKTIWDSCVNILRDDTRPLPLWAVAQHCGWNESELMTALINYTGHNSTVIDFSFGPRHRSIAGMADRNGSYAVGTLAIKA